MPKPKPTHLKTTDDGEKIVHVWDDDQYWAIETARAANRPLLVQGEPGIGKTQLAYAAAKMLKRPLVSFTVDSKTEARDLLWSFDAVQRLAKAQVASQLYGNDVNKLESELAVKNFVEPGPIWWAINWKEAADQAKLLGQKTPRPPKGWNQETDGVVVLIDEIDKADSDVPNGLLEALGMQQFTPQGWSEPVIAQSGVSPPLIIITTNEEQSLPDPFMRRCVVLKMKLPDCPTSGELEQYKKSKEIDPLTKYLVVRGKRRFGNQIPEAQLRQAAQMLMKDRNTAIEREQRPLPGQAEYFDFLRAMLVLSRERLAANADQSKEQVFQDISDDIGKFIFGKSEDLER